jgi:hypothetical protein
MLVDVGTQAGRGQLVPLLERHIRERTGRRVRRLEIHSNRDGLCVHGEAPTYYIKQLALHAVQEVLGATDHVPVRFDIRVL